MKASEHSISLARVFAAPPEALYAAFTDPAVMRRWMGTKVEAEIRIGGRYRIENDNGEGGVFFHLGEYLVLEPHHRIRQSFRAGFSEPELSGPSPYVNEFFEVTLRPVGEDQTELTLVNGWDGDGLNTEATDSVREGWSHWLDQLAEAVAKQEQAWHSRLHLF